VNDSLDDDSLILFSKPVVNLHETLSNGNFYNPLKCFQNYYACEEFSTCDSKI
jgi:hypothetical protein